MTLTSNKPMCFGRCFQAVAMLLTICAIFFPVFADYTRDLETARRFVAIGKFEEALEPLERLFAQNPKDKQIISLLKESYIAAKKYDKLAVLLNNQLTLEPNNASLHAEIGGIYLAQNQLPKAKEYFDRALKIAPQDESLVLQIHSMYSMWSFIDEDIELLRTARKKLGDNSRFAFELARLFEIKGQLDKAIEEYAAYLQTNPDRFPEIERRMELTNRSQQELRQLLSALDKLFGTQVPEWQPWRLKSIVLQALEDYPAAYTALEKAEKLRETSRRGAMMSQFVDDMLRQKEYTIAQKGAKFLMSETAGGFERTARQRLAAALRGMGDLNSAIAHLDTLVGAGKPQVSQEAAVLLAQIYLEDLREPQKAKKVIEDFTGTYGVNKSFNLGEDGVAIKGLVLIYERDFKSATSFLRDGLNLFSQSEKVAYLLGLTYFFAAEDDTAATVLHNVIAKFPKSKLADDCVEILLLMQTAQDRIDEFRVPIFASFTRDNKTAVTEWAKLAQKPDDKFGDFVLWKLGISQNSLNDTTAFITFNKLTKDYPKSFYAPLAYERIADRFIASSENAKAAEIFTRIVNDYPSAVNIESVRQKIRALGNM